MESFGVHGCFGLDLPIDKIKVKEGDETGLVPLCNFEVEEKSNSNYRPVREYVVWFANR